MIRYTHLRLRTTRLVLELDRGSHHTGHLNGALITEIAASKGPQMTILVFWGRGCAKEVRDIGDGRRSGAFPDSGARADLGDPAGKGPGDGQSEMRDVPGVCLLMNSGTIRQVN